MQMEDEVTATVGMLVASGVAEISSFEETPVRSRNHKRRRENRNA